MTSYYSKAYVDVQFKTSDRLELVIALYESAIAAVNQGIDAIETENDAGRMNALEQANQVLMLLSESLDFTQAGGMAGRLHGLYLFMMRQLLEANRDKSVEPLEIVRGNLSILLDGWHQAAQSEEVRRQKREKHREENHAPGEGRLAMMA